MRRKERREKKRKKGQRTKRKGKGPNQLALHLLRFSVFEPENRTQQSFGQPRKEEDRPGEVVAHCWTRREELVKRKWGKKQTSKQPKGKA